MIPELYPGIISKTSLNYENADIVVQLRTPALTCMICSSTCSCLEVPRRSMKYIPDNTPSHLLIKNKILLFTAPQGILDQSILLHLLNLADRYKWEKIKIDGSNPGETGRKFIHQILQILTNPCQVTPPTFSLDTPEPSPFLEQPLHNILSDNDVLASDQFQLNPDLLDLDMDSDQGIIKHSSLLHSTVGFPDRLLDQSEVHYHTDVTDFSQDLQSCLSGSDPAMETFLKSLFTTYKSIYPAHATDVGIMRSPKYTMDICLRKDDLNSLPRHSPFHCSISMKKCVSRILKSWEDSGIIASSPIRTHASRIIVAKKSISPSNLLKIKNRLEKDHQISLDLDNPNAIYSVDPDFLTLNEIKMSHRVCLDSRDLNSLTMPSATISPHPESVLFDLLMTMGRGKLLDKSGRFPNTTPADIKTSHYITPLGAPSPDPVHLLELDNITSLIPDDNELWISSIDISSAHTSINLTPRAQFLYNLISPDFRFYYHKRSCFGSQQISSHWNSSLVDILHDLIQLKLVVVYCDDVLIITQGRLLHATVVREVIRRLTEEGLKLGLPKCHFLPKTLPT